MTWCSPVLTDERYQCTSLKTVSLRTQLSEGLFIEQKSLKQCCLSFFFFNHNDFGVLVRVVVVGFWRVFFLFGFYSFFYSFFTLNKKNWGIFTFRDKQTKSCPNSQTLLLTIRETLSGFSAGPTSLLKLGVAEKLLSWESSWEKV